MLSHGKLMMTRGSHHWKDFMQSCTRETSQLQQNWQTRSFTYLMDLRRKCQKSTNFVDLDVTKPRKFDQAYYTNLQQKKGLLLTDQLLHSDPRTAPIVEAFATQPIFDPQFAASMVRLGNVHVLAGKNQGQIRLKCGYVNH